MKGDFSRSTYQPRKHYRSVLMQQGRVQLDADWNEQLDIEQHVIETSTIDTIGLSGVPDTGGGFRVDARQDGADLLISAGRMYVDGILCENETPIAYEEQFANDFPDNRKVSSLLTQANATLGFVFIDVWKRQITALEDPSIREVALGGSDHATRSKVVWQVKVLPLPGLTIPVSGQLNTLLSNRLTTSTALRTAESNNAPGAAQVQSQLDSLDGSIEILTAPAGVRCGMVSAPWTLLVTPPNGQLTARIHPGQAPSNPCELLPLSGFQRLENQLYRVEIHTSGTLGGAGAATFKWSRENGSVVTSWLSQDALSLRVASTGRDAPLGFAPGAHVELTDDTRDLVARPGVMVQIDKVEGNVITIKQPSTAVNIADFPRNPKLRRWDQLNAAEAVQVPGTNEGFIALEGGVEVRFSGSQFNAGDYWLIPARTAIADSEIGGIEWPQTAAGVPQPQSAAGITHHFARLGIVMLDGAGRLHVIADCRDRLPALTGLAKLQYLGGDGQEAPPGQALAQPLRAGVSVGTRPVPGALVRFRVLTGNGTLTGGLTTVDVPTNESGIASTNWTIDGTNPTQTIEAQLLGGSGQFTHLPIRYNARISTATAPAVLRLNDLRMISNGLLLRNQTQVVPDELGQGIRIFCSGPVSSTSLTRSLSCFVTLFIPFPLGSGEVSVWGTSALVGFHPIVVNATVTFESSNNAILWRPTPEARAWLTGFFGRLTSVSITSVPVRLSIKGNFIMPSAAPFLALDAEAFLDQSIGTIVLPTGRGRPGSDLELWFTFVNARGGYGTLLGLAGVAFQGFGTQQV
jgi:hypothetical protein